MPGWLISAEIPIVFLLVLGFGYREYRKTNKLLEEARAEEAAAKNKDQAPSDVASEPSEET